MEIKPDQLTPEFAAQLLWFKSNLDFKLDLNQVELKRLYRESKDKIIVWALSRQIGKSYTLCTIGIEECLRTPNIAVKFLAPTQKMARTIMKQTMRQLLQDCPKELRPEYKVADGLYLFPNGSEIQILGSDGGRADNIRGSRAHLILVDECGFITDLDYIVKSILVPTTTTTKGKIILSSTPPKSPDHDFVKFANHSRDFGSYCHRTIYDNPRLTKEDIDDLANTVGGYDTVDFKREYLSQFLRDDNYSVIPEFTPEVKDSIVKEWPKPPHYDGYVAMDVGLKDLTVALFAYYDFKAGKLIIEDEFCLNGQRFTTSALADGIKEKEDFCFTDALSGEQREPYLRVSDTNLTVIADLRSLHGLNFLPTRKDDALAALNQVRMSISEQKIIINPRCKTLIRHLENAVWNKNRTDYERSPTNFHYDALDALKYLVRNVQWTKNPYPMGWGRGSLENVYTLRAEPNHPQQDIFNKMFNLKKKK